MERSRTLWSNNNTALQQQNGTTSVATMQLVTLSTGHLSIKGRAGLMTSWEILSVSLYGTLKYHSGAYAYTHTQMTIIDYIYSLN